MISITLDPSEWSCSGCETYFVAPQQPRLLGMPKCVIGRSELKNGRVRQSIKALEIHINDICG